MIITDIQKRFRLEKERSQPYLPMLPYDIQIVCNEVVQSGFPSVSFPAINVFFCKIETLACICPREDRADIFVHVLLNDKSTPLQVCQHIVAHELVHLVVPPETIDGRQVAHTGTFWRHEARVSPYRLRSWAWIHFNLSSCIRRDQKSERTVIKRNWKQFLGQERCSWERCDRIVAGSMW